MHVIGVCMSADTHQLELCVTTVQSYCAASLVIISVTPSLSWLYVCFINSLLIIMSSHHHLSSHNVNMKDVFSLADLNDDWWIYFFLLCHSPLVYISAWFVFLLLIVFRAEVHGIYCFTLVFNRGIELVSRIVDVHWYWYWLNVWYCDIPSLLSSTLLMTLSCLSFTYKPVRVRVTEAHTHTRCFLHSLHSACVAFCAPYNIFSIITVRNV